VTSHKEHIQVLIAEIDNVLQRTNPRLPWVMSGEVAQQRQVLERVRNFLVALQQTFPMQDGGQPLDGVNTLAAQMGISPQSPPTGLNATSDMTPYQMMQAILQEVSYLRANLSPALSQPPPPQSQLTAELLQVLMSRLQENLTQQISQTLNQLRQSPAYSTPPMLSGGMPPVPVPSQYEQLHNLRSRSDQMLVNLDSTLNVVFESLQRNIQAYQEALSQGLERMYSMGQQSEYTFKVLIDQLAQQLKQEASSYLLASPPTESAPPTQPAPETSQAMQTGVEARQGQPSEAMRSPNLTAASPSIAATPAVASSPNAAFPYAGTELLSAEISGTDLTSPPEPFPSDPSNSSAETPLDSAIESWLQSVSAMNLDVDLPGESGSSSALPPLDLSDLELDTLDDSRPSPSVAKSASITPAIPPTASFTPAPTASAFPPAPAVQAPSDESAVGEDDTADIDAVLKLLEELSAEVETAENATSLEDAEAQLEQVLEASIGEDTGTGVDLPGDAQEELDEFLQDDFYQSLFGSEAETQSETTPEISSASVTNKPIEDKTPDSSPGLASSDFADVLNLDQLTLDEDEELSSFSTDLESAIASTPSLEDSEASLPSLTTDLEPAIAADLSFELTQPVSDMASDEAPLFLELPADLFDTNSAVATPNIDFPDSAETIDRVELDLGSESPTEQPSIDSAALFEWDTISDTAIVESQTASPAAADLADIGSLANLFQDSPNTMAQSVPVEAEEVGSLTDLFQGVPDTAARSVPVDPPVVRPTAPVVPTPVSSEPEELFLGDDLFGQERISEVSEDQFTRAAVDEILLPEAAQSQNGLNLEVDDFTLSSLSEDLSNLEEPVDQAVLTGSEAQLQALALPETEVPAVATPTVTPAEETLSLEDFAASLATPTNTQPAPFYQASPAIADLSVEGFADLFGDTPPSPPASLPSIPLNATESLPFSLEGTNQLFVEHAPPTVNRPVQSTPTEASPFTLEGMDDLFSDAPTLNQATYSSINAQVPVETPDETEKPFTLEGMDDLFGNAPSIPTPTTPAPIQATPIQPPAPSARREIPPFRPELFHPDDVVEADPPFKLEQLDNLFAETSVESTSETAIAGSSTPTAVPDQQTLDAAFESLLGTPPNQTAQNRSSQSNSQKKKTP